MGLQSALTTALTGLQAAETTIDVVGNNVANSQTVGFKESDAAFATQFLQTISIGAAPSSNSGGTNPRQIGLGVKVAEITPKFTQGTIEISSNPLDLAIQGDGFLIVQAGTKQLYTRNGQLKLNAQNEVVTTTGQRLLGYGVNDEFEVVTDNLVPLSIPLGKERVAQATESAILSGVLNPAVAEGDQPEIIESRVLGNGAIDQPDSANFTIADINEAVAPGTFVATESATPGGPAAGAYSYRIVNVDANGLEGGISAEVPVTSASGNQIDLTGLPDATGDYTSRNVYRTEAGGSTFYLLENIGATGDYVDDDVPPIVAIPANELDSSGIEVGSYSYYVTYYNSSDPSAETRPTSKVGPVAISANGNRIRLDLSDIPAPPITGYDQMKIYRNVSGSSNNFRLVDTVPAAGELGYVDSYIDTSPSSAIASNTALDLDGPPANNTTLLTDIVVRQGEVYTNPFEEGVLTFSGNKDGVDTPEKQLTITATSTVLDLVEFMRDALGIDQESSISDVPFPEPTGNVEISTDGKLRVTSNMGQENAIDIPLTGLSLLPTGSTVSQSIPLSFGSTQSAVGPGTSTEFIAYDSLGLPTKIRLTTVLEAKDGNSTTYRWYANSANNEPLTGVSTVVGNGILVFDSKGDLDDDNPVSRISVLREDTASESPLQITLDFSTVKALGETDAQGNPISSLNVTSQDGFPPGVLTSFIITEDGLIQGQFSNGTQRAVGQVVMARFSNNAGLQQVGDSLFNVGVNSGEPIFGFPGEEGIGSLTAGAVELSNTDIGQNLIQLILASTQYRGGARVITATQELLDELLSLAR